MEDRPAVSNQPLQEEGAPLSVPKIPYVDAHAPDGKRTMLYRFYNAEGELLYVGITDQPQVRWAAHARNSLWWPRFCIVHTEWLATRADAEVAEAAAIRRERPRHNVSHSVVPTPTRRLSAMYLHPMARQEFGDDPFTYRDLSERLSIPYGTVAVYGRRLIDEGTFRKVGTRGRRGLFIALKAVQ